MSSSNNRMHKRPRYDSRDEISMRHEFDTRRYVELDSQVKMLKSELENEENLRKKVQLFLGEKLAEIEQLQKQNNSMHRAIEQLQSQLESTTKQLHIALGMTVNKERRIPPSDYINYQHEHPSQSDNMREMQQSSYLKQRSSDKRSSTEERMSKRRYESPSSSKHSINDRKSSEYSKVNNDSLKQNFQIFVGDLSRDINIEKLRDAFLPFGEITDVKVMEDAKNSFLKGYGFVSFANQRDAERAIRKMDGTRLGRRRIRTNWAESKLESSNQLNLSFGEIMSQIGPEVTSIFAGNIPKNAGYDDLITAFERYGKITTIRDFTEQGNVFITFKTKESAAKAIQQMNNTNFMGHIIKCYWAKGNSQTNWH